MIEVIANISGGCAMVQPSSVRCMALGTRPDSHKERKAYATQRKYYGSAIECRLHDLRHKAGFSQGGATQRKYYGSAIELHGPRHKVGHRHKAGSHKEGRPLRGSTTVQPLSVGCMVTQKKYHSSAIECRLHDHSEEVPPLAS